MTSDAQSRRPIAVVLALLAGGCAVGPDYERPKIVAPASHRFDKASSAASLADLPWWKVFGDEALHALVTEALSRNFDLVVAAARVDEARSQALATGAQLLPSVTATGQGSYGNALGGLGAAPQPFWLANGIGNVSWEIDLFGKLRRAREAARAQFFASEEAKRGVWVTVLGDVAQSYFQLLGLDLQRSIALRTVAARSNVVDLFRVRAEGGVGTDLDVARAEADLFAARESLVNIELSIALTENSISLLLGKAPGPIKRSKVATELSAPPEVPAGLPSTLLQRRPDVREAEAELVAANARIGVATANLFPTFSLTGVGGIVTTNLALASGGGGVRTSGLYSAGAEVSWAAPILQGAALRHLRDAAKAEWRAVYATYVKTVTNAFKDVADALVTLAQLRDRRVNADKQVAALARAVDVSQTQFAGGVATYLDVITAQELLFPNELSLAQLEGQQLVAYVQLYRALGGGWWFVEPPEED